MALSAEPADPDHADDPDRIPDRNAQGGPRVPADVPRGRVDPERRGTDDRSCGRAFLGLLAAESDTLIAANHGPETAREASERAGRCSAETARLGGTSMPPRSTTPTVTPRKNWRPRSSTRGSTRNDRRPHLCGAVRRPPAWDGGIAVSDESTASGPDGWPVALRGVTESIVTTFGPNDRWNVAALGAPRRTIRTTPSPPRGRTDAPGRGGTSPRGGGVVQFTTDPRTFVDAALTVREVDEPVLPTADAWVEVTVEEIASETEGGTTVRTWALDPVEHAVVRERVPTI